MKRNIAVLFYAVYMAVSCSMPLYGDVRELKFKISQSNSIGLIEFVWVPYEGGFWISKEELTRGQISMICGSNVLIGWSHDGISGGTDKPVDYLNAKRCQILLNILNEDHNIHAYVPSEAQMLAIHNNTQKIQSWEMGDYGWFSGKYAHPTKAKKPTSFGLYDFYGNVYELCRNNGVSAKAILDDKNTHWRGGSIGGSTSEACKYVKKEKYESYTGLRLCIDIADDKIVNGSYTWMFQKNSPFWIRPWYYKDDEDSLYELYADIAKKLKVEIHKPTKREVLYKTGFRFDISKLPLTARVTPLIIQFYNELNHLVDVLTDTELIFNGKGFSEHSIDRRLIGDENRKDSLKEWISDGYKEAWTEISEVINDLYLWDAIFADSERGLKQIKNCVQRMNQLTAHMEFQLQKARHIREAKAIEEEKESQGIVNDEDIVKIYKKHKDSLVIVTVGTMTGTGFLVENGGKTYLYTNKHVLEKGGKSSITRIGGEQLKCRTLEFNRDRDLARGEVVDSWNRRFSYFEFSQNMPNIGDDIFVIGNSDGLGVQKLLRGKIVGISVDETVIEIDADIVPGNSGSAVLNAAGKVVGIATFGIGERKFAIRPKDSDEWVRINWKKYNQQLQNR